MPKAKMLRRDANGERVLAYHIKDKYKDMTLEQIYNAEKRTTKCDDPSVSYTYAAKYMDFVDYDFDDAYVADPQDTGNRPGIYIEFKESWLNPKDMEVRVYNAWPTAAGTLPHNPKRSTSLSTPMAR